MQEKKKSLVQSILDEQINFGGEIISRGEAYRRMKKEGFDNKACDYIAFSYPAYNPCRT